MVKIMTNISHHLRLGHFVCYLHHNDVIGGFVLFEPFLQLNLGFARSENQDGTRFMKMRNNLVIKVGEMPRIIPLTRDITGYFVGFERTWAFAISAKLFFNG